MYDTFTNVRKEVHWLDGFEDQRQLAEQRNLAARIINDCAPQMYNFRLAVAGAVVANEDDPTVTALTHGVYMEAQEEISARWEETCDSYKHYQRNAGGSDLYDWVRGG